MTHEHLPEGWKRVRLKSVTREIKQRNSDHAFTVADVLGVSNKIGFYPNDREIKDDVSRYKVITHHDFGYNPMRLNVGSLAYRNRPEPGLISPDYVAFRCDTNQLLPEYFNYFRQTSGWWHQIENGGQGSVRIRYYYSDIANFTILLPPVDEQCRITEILHDADANIVCIEAQIETAQEVKRGVMQQLFTFGLAGEGAPTKQTKIGEIPAAWGLAPLQKLCSSIVNGYVGPTKDIYRDRGIPYLVSKNIKPNALIEKAFAFVDEQFQAENKRSILCEGDVLTVQTGSIGDSCVVPQKFSGANCHALIISRTMVDKLHPVFLCQYFNSEYGQGRFARIQTGMAHPHLNTKDLRLFIIPIPPTEEQREIADILSAHDTTIHRLQAEVVSLRKVKRGLMQKLLSGEVRV